MLVLYDFLEVKLVDDLLPMVFGLCLFVFSLNNFPIEKHILGLMYVLRNDYGSLSILGVPTYSERLQLVNLP